MIEKRPFGATGHMSSRTLFGGAAFKPTTDQAEADQTLEVLHRFGVNHIDTAASYGGGNSEKLIGGWMRKQRSRFFLATKTGERTREGAWKQLRTSLEKLQVEYVDLIQMHNLTDPKEWETAMGPDGALAALTEAREKGLVRHIGVTGHGFNAPAMHWKSLDRFPFASVLLPFNYLLAKNDGYRDGFRRLLDVCGKRNVAVQVIKSIARRPWAGREHTHGPWYEPLSEQADIDLAVRFVLGNDGVFLNTAADRDLLPRVLDAASRGGPIPSEAEMEALAARTGMSPIFDEKGTVS
jgi:aryl-alcohol dehydrogenase-like predicted oxidoreductase